MSDLNLCAVCNGTKAAQLWLGYGAFYDPESAQDAGYMCERCFKDLRDHRFDELAKRHEERPRSMELP